jgi:cyclophilin family peptidyl-prolyl cis-trans isomerase
MPRLLLALLLAGLLALSACGGSSSNTGSKPDSAATPTAAGTATSTGCQKVDKPAPKSVKLAKPTTGLDPAKSYVATVSTSCGDFQITLDAKRAPKTGGSFQYLADKGFFDNTTFHRIVAGFVIQGGDPKGDGTGGPGYKVVEAPPKDLQYGKGVVAMAKTQLEAAGTSGSQFFVVTGESTPLPPEYALLGKVTGGQDVVDKIAAADTDPSTEQPVEPIVIRSIKVAAT